MEEIVKTGVAHFSVEGEFLTRIARDMMLSDMPGKAWRIIADSLMGPGADGAARGILEGTMKLTGVNELELVEEDPEDDALKRYLSDLRYIYAGRMRLNGGWYRPTAKTRMTRKSARYAADRADPNAISPTEALHDWTKRAARWFAHTGEIVRLVGQVWVIFEPCGERPFWWDELRDAEAAVKERVEAHGCPLEVRGGETRQEAAEHAEESLRARSVELKHEADDAKQEADEARYEAREQARDKAIIEIGEKVREQAGDDTFVLTVPAECVHVDLDDMGYCKACGNAWYIGDEPTPERKLVVPRAPFVCWALSRTSLRHLSPPWEVVARSGMKMMLDDPYHTDWMLGAGLDLSEDYGYNSPVTKAAGSEMFHIQEELGEFEAAVLVDHGPISGTVGKDIIVLPNLSPKHAEAAMKARAIITERGGRLAHLAVIGLEMGWTIMLVPDAVTRYPAGAALTLDPRTGTIRMDWTRT